MDRRTTQKLELDKILRQLAEHAAFSASREMLEDLTPTPYLDDAQIRQQETTEARTLLEEKGFISVGGAHDVRPQAGKAQREIPLSPPELLQIRGTLEAAARLKGQIEKVEERFPLLGETAVGLYGGKPLVEAITNAIGDQGEVLDSASAELGRIRYGLRTQRDRLHTKLQSIISSGAYQPYLQEALITQRGGRYVIPVRAESKGRIKGIVHDQSASGATVYVEPMATVEINNRIRELEAAERDEVERILRALTAEVAAHAERIVWCVESLAELDVAFAKAKYAATLRAHPPTLVAFDRERFPGSTVQLYSARHPLIDPDEVVPIDAVLDEGTFILVITGPNTGGKTVSLKTVGLLTLMAQCGLHIPAAPESMLSVFSEVYADIGDEQSIEQSLSTFSAHLTHIIDILDHAGDRSLVLLDELGAGTDPTEGAAIARAILEDLRERGSTTFVATHYPELKLYAHSTPGVRNASVEFNVQTLAPTYRLMVGLPGRSNALAIATRLGLPGNIIERARGYVGAEDLAADDLLDDIHRTRAELKQSAGRLSRSERDSEILRDRLQRRLDAIEEERRGIIEEARAEAQSELAAVREEIGELRKRLRTIPPSYREEAEDAQDVVEEVSEGAEALGEVLAEPVAGRAEPAPEPPPREEPEPPPEPPGELQAGDRVYVPTLDAEGEIVALDGDAEVQVGQFRVRVDPGDLEFRGRGRRRRREDVDSEATYERVRRPRPESPGIELHLRGMTLDEALPLLEDYLDQAYLSGLPWVRIVHGKGTGVLRRGVRQTLERNPLIKEFRSAKGGEGGDGVTVVHFVPLA
jgi:DNA mismatch repair protein MutS2